ncbi:UNVERIFIED_CONTAM: hypothetical protein FKN15_003901 [Acipenser sinensis]
MSEIFVVLKTQNAPDGVCGWLLQHYQLCSISSKNTFYLEVKSFDKRGFTVV